MTTVLVAVPVFILGFILGVVVGVKVQHHRLTREVVVQARSIRRGLEAVNTWVAHWLALILVAIFALAAYSVYYGAAQKSADRDCLTTYANHLSDSLTPRQAASEALQRADQRFNDALVRLLRAAVSGTPTEAQRHARAVELARAAQHKQEVAQRLSVERAANPYPQPPKKVCPK